jgi:hypothetical protein
MEALKTDTPPETLAPIAVTVRERIKSRNNKMIKKLNIKMQNSTFGYFQFFLEFRKQFSA